MKLRVALASVANLIAALAFTSIASAGAEATSYDIRSTDQTIRVGLVRSFRGAKQITVLASSNCTVERTGSAGNIATCTNLEPITLDASNGKLTLRLVNGSGVDAGASVTLKPDDAGGMLSVDSPGKPCKQYRGALEVALKSSALRVVNVVTIEDYLPGVLTGEMPSSYPDEALRSQAIAARGYTLCACGRHASSGYDLCDDSHCQVYDGAMREKPSATRAVLSTRGQILTFGGRIAPIMYCADCGGATECYAEAHRTAIPYMPNVTEPEGITHCTWEKSYKLTELSAKLVAAGMRECGGLEKIAIARTSSSGRALTFEITGCRGTATIDGAKLRTALGRDGIRSTLCTVTCSQDGVVTFRGKGWGHGIGMCQVGAGALACPPFSYTCAQILAHYYPGTVLTAPSGSLERFETAKERGYSAPQDAKQSKEAKGPKHSPPPHPSSTGERARDIGVRVDAPRL